MEKQNASFNSIWKNTTFTKLFVAFGVSSFGDWFDLLAISDIMCYVWHVSPFVASLWGLTFSLPSVILSQYAGVLADKVGQLKIMRLTDVIRFVVTISLLWAPNPWWVLGLLTVRGALAAFNQPAQSTLNRHVVRDEQLLQANGITSSVSQVSKIAGPFLGAAVMGITTPYFCLALNATSFLLSFVILMRVKGISVPRNIVTIGTRSSTMLQVWKDGWRVLLRDRVLSNAVLILSIIGLTIQISDTMWAVLLRSIMPAKPEWLGYLISTVGLGALPCTVVLARRNNINSFSFTLGTGAFLTGAGFLVLGLFRAGWTSSLLLLGALVMGMGVGIFYPSHNFLIQKQSPPEVLGRVSGIINSLTSLATIIGPMLGGLLTTRFGPSFTFTVTGGLTALVGGTVFIAGNVLFRTSCPRQKPCCTQGALADRGETT